MCSAEMVALIDECITEISRITCTPLVKLQNDTVACFDRQVTPHAMLNSRKYEVPDKACKLLAATLQQTKYHVKTALGVSTTSYASSPSYPHYGQGQGSGHAGTIWLFESTPMMETIEKPCTGLDITSPDHTVSYKLHIIGLVDDKRQYANDWTNNSEITICNNLQTAASSWEQILHTSGGALELFKCAWYLIQWDFTSSGIPFISTKPNNNTIDITSSSDKKQRSIQNLTIHETCKYLGVTSAPDENQTHQYNVILKNAKTGAYIITANPFNHHQAFLYFVSHLLPKLTSPLTSAALTTKQYNKIEGAFHPSVIAAMGYNRTWPIALRYGTHLYGGLQMKSLEVEALIKKIQCLRSLMNKKKHKNFLSLCFLGFNTLQAHVFQSSNKTINPHNTSIVFGLKISFDY